ncbi:hypothetical protein [Xanthobacter sediminis]
MEQNRFDLIAFLFNQREEGRPHFQNIKAVRQFLAKVLTFNIDDPYALSEPTLNIKNTIYDKKYFTRKIQEDHLAFMRSETLYLPSLKISGANVRACSECHFSRFSVVSYVDFDDPCLLILVATMPLFIFNLNTRTIHFTTSYRAYPESDLIAILSYIFWRQISYDTLFLVQTSVERRAIVIGDNRPTHFIRQSLGFIDWALEAHILPFLSSGGEIWIVRDQCFVDPTSIFPQLHRGQITYLDDSNANLQYGRGIRQMRRIYRVEPQFTDLNFAASMTKEGGGFYSGEESKFYCLISLDIEKSRFINQESCISEIIKYLMDLSTSRNKQLSIIWDGWTLKRFGLPDRKDKDVIQRLKSTIQNMDLPRDMEQEFIFDKTFDEKLRCAAKANLAITTHGTAALIPCRLLKIPTITYHVSAIMERREEIEPTSFFPVSEEFISEDPTEMNVPADRRHFSLNPEGVRRAMVATGVFD